MKTPNQEILNIIQISIYKLFFFFFFSILVICWLAYNWEKKKNKYNNDRTICQEETAELMSQMSFRWWIEFASLAVAQLWWNCDDMWLVSMSISNFEPSLTILLVFFSLELQARFSAPTLYILTTWRWLMVTSTLNPWKRVKISKFRDSWFFLIRKILLK